MIEMATWQRHRWQRDTRYYEALLHQDLFGHWILTRIWGSCDTAIGNHKHELLEDLQTAQAHLATIAKRRKQRGYVPVHRLSTISVENPAQLSPNP